jgi:hypothetical protein
VPRGCRRHALSAPRVSHHNSAPLSSENPYSNSRVAAGSPEQLQRSMKVRVTVQLTEKEERIFERLLDVVRHFDLGTQLRVAGGWVRDKVIFFLIFFFGFGLGKRNLSFLVCLGCLEYQKVVEKF